MSDRLTDEQLCDIKESHSPMLWDEVSEVVTELLEARKQQECHDKCFDALVVAKNDLARADKQLTAAIVFKDAYNENACYLGGPTKGRKEDAVYDAYHAFLAVLKEAGL